MKVLVVGGYGTFGGRLARLLADEPRVTLLMAGRSLAKARALCAELDSRSTLVPWRFDRDGDLDAQLGEAAPDLVVDASGPFQAYGERPYRLAQACIARGIDYLDLADGADFVAGIATLDDAARARGVFALSGVSTCPALTAAVVRRLSEGWRSVRSVTAGIAPTPWAGLGLSVVKGIAGYAGRPVKLVRDGRPAEGGALIESRRVTIAPPGQVPLRSLHFSLVDTPDLQVLPPLHPGLRDIWFGAGPTPESLHRMLNGMAWLVRWRLLPTLEPLAPLFHWAINRLRWGEHRGGMFVAVAGEDADGRPVARSWHLVAEGADGPFIPSMAAEATIRGLLDGRRPAAGARPATSDLELADFEPAFARKAIAAGVREPVAEAEPVYHQVLGPAWDGMPPAWRAMHQLPEGETKTVSGRASVERGRSLLARLAGTLMGFPGAGDDVPVSVAFSRRNGVELWRRTFAGRSFASRQEAGRGRSEHLVVERFGPVAVHMAAATDGETMRLVIRRFSVLGVPLPLWLGPTTTASERVEDGRFRFDVEIGHPLTGRIVLYRGWLA
ncbi:SDR family oxidoreductase [Caulobacter mirabilis]|uniref:SDR family oxidoreductase n=1 Tax=Caulobacter mirabilis TaxID=69666 RepID=UPI001C0EFA68|nr:SDR family oxidoreductase [Caulobacter mirabilis]